jgi:aspartate racemase
MNKKIGLLGGIGPESTGEFYLSLISKYQEKGCIHCNEDFPQIIINSIPAPELMIEDITQREIEPYLRGLMELQMWGAHFIALICNTIHSFYEVLQGHIETPIIDLRREMKNAIFHKNVKSIIILGTPTTIKKKLYRFDGIACWELDKGEIKQLAAAVFNFNKGFERQRQIQTVEDIARGYTKTCDLLVAACSEIALMLKDKDLPVINPMDVLAEATVEYSLKPNLIS